MSAAEAESNTLVREGKMKFMGFHTWYRILGERTPGTFPLLILHGGPGCGHDYLTSLDDLTQEGRQLIYYDQLGCGNSAVPEGKIHWDRRIFLEELEQLRLCLGLEEVHILGQSWGGMLAMEYLEGQPQGVKSLIVSSSPASMRRWQEEAWRLIEQLPEEDQEAIRRCEASGNYEDEAYDRANELYSRLHVCSLNPYPAPVARSLSFQAECYRKMIGPSEFSITGNLKDWDICEDLGKIKVPTLILSGSEDEATPEMMREVQAGIAGSHLEILPGTHLVHWEQRERYNQLVGEFLEKVERSFGDGQTNH